MSDGTRLNPGLNGDLIQTEDISGAKYPVSKIILGNKDVNDGDVSATNPLPVTGTISISSSVTVTTSPTGTQTVAPSGTQTVAGTVTAVQSGTYTTAVTSSVTTTDKTQSTGLTAAGTAAVATNGCGTAYLTLTGNGAGMSFTIQGKDSAGNWNNIAALTLAGSIVTAGTTLSANGQWLVPCAGFAQVRANLTAITSGTATFSWEAGSASQVVNIINTVTTSPTGTQAVSGTVTTVQSGTFTTSPTGTQTVIQASTSSVTVVPSGTQTVSGTVTANAGTGTFTTSPTGTQTVAGSGTFTTSPTGTQTVSGTVTAVQSGTYTTSLTGTQTVAQASSVTTTDHTQSTGLTAAGTVAVATNGCGTAYLTLTGNGAGMSFTIQGQDSNSNWNNIAAITLAGANVIAGTTLSANGQWLVPCAGFANVRANLTAITSGTATFSWEAGSASQVVNITNTVTTSPTGTQTIAPTGTQTIIPAATSSVTVVPSGTQTVAGTVTAVQSGTYTTNPTGTQTVAYGSGTFVTSDLADGSVAGGTAGSKSMLAGGQYNTAAPALTNTQQVALQVDSSGRLIIVPTVTAVQSGTYTTNPTGTQTIIPAATSSVTVVPSGTQTVTPTGTQTVAYGSGTFTTFDLADGPVTAGAVAAKSLLVGGQFNTALPSLTNTQQAALQFDSSGRVIIVPTVTAVQSGTYTTSPTGTQTIISAATSSVTVVPSGTQTVAGTITANAGTGNFTVVQTTASNLNANVSGTVTSNAGTGTFTTSPTGTQTVTGTVTANAGTGTFTIAPTGTQTVTQVSSVTNTDNTQSTGLTAAGTVVVATNGCGTAYLTLTGNGAGMSFTIQGKDSAGNWNNIAAITLAGNIVTVGTTLSANGQWIVPCAGFAQVRANLTAITSGTATFSWEASSGSQAVNITNTVTTSPTGTQTVAGTVTSNAGTGTFTTSPTGTQTVIQAPTSSVTIVPSGTQTVTGDTTSGSTDAGNPVKIGGLAKTSLPTAVSDGQRVSGLFDKLGRIVTSPMSVRAQSTRNRIALTTTAETTLLSAAGAGVFTDITDIIICNNDTSNDHSGVQVNIRDSTGGTIAISIVVNASQSVDISFAVPLTQTTANNNWTAQLATIPNATITITVLGIHNS